MIRYSGEDRHEANANTANCRYVEARAEPRFFPQRSPDERTADSRWKGKHHRPVGSRSAPRLNPLFGT